MRGFPPPPPNFVERKRKILEQLAIPETEYTDASPKGSIDVGIRDLIDEINDLEGFVTTSSCAGRVSVFVEGRKAAALDSDEASGEDGRRSTMAGVGGKGGGGVWLFVSHDPVAFGEGGGDLEELLGLKTEIVSQQGTDSAVAGPSDSRLVHFKFEPMILHVLTASAEHAQLILRCGLQAGFRESGAINLVAAQDDPVTPIVAIRSMGLSLESLIGVQTEKGMQVTVSREYLQTLLQVSNERFKENRKRIDRFRNAMLDVTRGPTKKDGSEWEDADARRERKKAEGLRRKAELLAQKQSTGESVDTNPTEVVSLNADST